MKANGRRMSPPEFKRMLPWSEQELEDYLEVLAQEADKKDYSRKFESSKACAALDAFLDSIVWDPDTNVKSKTEAIRREMDAVDAFDIDHFLWLWGVDFDDFEHFYNLIEEGV